MHRRVDVDDLDWDRRNTPTLIARRTRLNPVAKLLTRGFRVYICVLVDNNTATTLRPRSGVCTDVTMIEIWLGIEEIRPLC